MSSVPERSIDVRLDEIWTRHLPDTVTRIEHVVEALHAIQRGTSDREGRESACTDAHRVVGVAATYGRTDLTALARAAERLLRAPELSAAQLDELARVAGQLDEFATS